MNANKYFALILDERNNPHITKRFYILEEIMEKLDTLSEQIDNLQESVDFDVEYFVSLVLEKIEEKKDYNPITDDNPKVQF